MSTNRLLLTYEPPEQRTRAIEWVLLRWTLLHGQDHLLFGELERKEETKNVDHERSKLICQFKGGSHLPLDDCKCWHELQKR
jgi:hypothetical protein